MASFPTATDSTTTTTPLRPPEQGGLKCPRCDSPNTKFCYFNNYSLTQPRHFCKTCRRYWTKGGALRNVPVGGGCRKNKKKSSGSGSASSSSSSSRIHLDPFDPTLPDPAAGGLLYSGLSPAPPSMDFQLGLLPFYGGTSTGMGFNYPLASGVYNELGGSGSGSSSAVNCNTLASSIESLSSINQDLHLKLQQQRMSMFFGGGGAQKDSSLPALPAPLLHEHHHHHHQHEPISFQATDAEDDRKGTDATTAWFLETPSIVPFANPSSSNNTGNWGGGFQAWNGMQQFNSS